MKGGQGLSPELEEEEAGRVSNPVDACSSVAGRSSSSRLFLTAR